MDTCTFDVDLGMFWQIEGHRGPYQPRSLCWRDGARVATVVLARESVTFSGCPRWDRVIPARVWRTFGPSGRLDWTVPLICFCLKQCFPPRASLP